MGTCRLVYFRADGNSQIASGHLVRCFSVALACLHLDMKVCFLISDGESQSLLQDILGACQEDPQLKDKALHHNGREDNISMIRLKTAAFDCPERELPEVLSLLTPDADSVVYFLDSYYVTETYLAALRPIVKIAYLDDLRLFDYPVDLLINYDVIPDAAMPAYKSAYQKAGKLLLGAAYTPLRIQFQNKKAFIREQVSHILITTGAGDPYHFSLKFIEEIEKSSFAGPAASQSLTLHVVVGRFNMDKEALCQLAEKSPYLILHENVSDMASLMQTCDLAISAAGTTLYELCALGIPAVSFTMADNQLSSAQAFEETGLIPCAGDMRANPDAVLRFAANFVTSMSYIPNDSLTDKSESYNSSFAKRTSIHTRMSRFVDGKGAYRIAQALKDL